jgi:tetratricopeptide (TPR) repeat protein
MRFPEIFPNTKKVITRVIYIVWACFLCAQVQAQSTFSSAPLSETSESVKEKAKLSGELAFKFRETHPDSTKKYANIALELGTQIKDPKIVSNALIDLAFYYKLQADFDSARITLQKNITVQELSKASHGIANGYKHLGFLSISEGKFTQAIEEFEKGINSLKGTQNQAIEAKLRAGLGSAFTQLDENTAAMNAFKKSLEISTLNKDSVSMANTLTNIGQLLQKTKRKELALIHYGDALKINQIKGNQIDEIKTIESIGALYYEMNKLDSALLFLTANKKKLEKLQIPELTHKNYSNIAIV